MVQVRQSTVIDAPIEEVWRILRDFNGHDRWHPAVASSEIEDGKQASAVGSVRRFRLSDGSLLREQLLSLSDKDCSLKYCLLEAPLPLMGYVASIRLKPVTDGNQTFWQWHCEFQPPAHRREELVSLVTNDIYQAGFAAIRRLLMPGQVAVQPISAAIATRGAAPAPRRALVHPTPVPGATIQTKAIVIDRYGGPDVLQLREIDLPPPGAGTVRIHHRAIGVNFMDIYCRTGYFDLLKPPGVPGMEAAGVIEAVGPGVAGFVIGERVAYACAPVGAYCERRNMAAELLVRLPDDVDDHIAAAALLKGVTASFLLHDVCKVEAGNVVLVHAAAGGVGQFLVQWARHLGATVLATVSNEEKASVAKRLGAHHVILYSREDFADAVMDFTSGRGVDVVYDAVGAETFARSFAALAIRGHLVSFGQASGPIGNRDIGSFSSKSVTISRPNYEHYTGTADRLALQVGRLLTAVRQGAISIEPPVLYELARASDAHRDLESRRTVGSLVLTV